MAIAQKCKFTINLGGESSINIIALSKILNSMATLTSEASKCISECESCEFNVLAVNKGSFELV